MKNFLSRNKHLIFSLSAFLFTLVSFILSFFKVIILDNTNFITGNDLYFGEYFNGYTLVVFLLFISCFLVIFLSLFIKNIEVLQTFLLIILTGLFAFIPNVVMSNQINPIPYTSIYSYSSELSVGIAFLLLSICLLISRDMENYKFTTREICELGMLIGLAVAFNFWPKIPLHWAGSINFQIVPLVIIALRFSPLKTFISVGLVFGLIVCLTDGYGLFAYPLEYFLAFGSVAIISIFRNYILSENSQKPCSSLIKITLLIFLIMVQTTIRFFCASLDSCLFYYSSLDISKTSSAFVAAMIYNAPYVFITGASTAGIVGLLYFPIKKLNKMFKNTK